MHNACWLVYYNTTKSTCSSIVAYSSWNTCASWGNIILYRHLLDMNITFLTLLGHSTQKAATINTLVNIIGNWQIIFNTWIKKEQNQTLTFTHHVYELMTSSQPTLWDCHLVVGHCSLIQSFFPSEGHY